MAKVILVGGSIATGKSTLSKRISEELGIPRVAMDDLKEVLFDYIGYRDRQWSSQIGTAMFPVFETLVEMFAQRGESVVAEAVFSWWPEDADWINSLAQKYGVEVVMIWLVSDPRVARERFIQRGERGYHPGHCHSTESILEEFDQKFFNKTLLPLPTNAKTKMVDTTDFDAVDYEDILRWISSLETGFSQHVHGARL